MTTRALLLLLFLTLFCCSQDELLPINVKAQSLIAFDHVNDNIWKHEIYVVNPQTKEIQQLTDDNNIDKQPSWSPDGLKLAYVSRRTKGIAGSDFLSNPPELVVVDFSSLEIEAVRNIIDSKVDSIGKILEQEGVEVFWNSSFYRGQKNPEWISENTLGFQADLPFGYLIFFPLQYHILKREINICFSPKIKARYQLEHIAWVSNDQYYAVQNPKANPGVGALKYPQTLVLYSITSGKVDTLFQQMTRISNLSCDTLNQQLLFVSDDPEYPEPDDTIFSFDLELRKKETVVRGTAPKISRDGSSLAYVRRVADKSYAIFVMNFETKIEKQIVEMPGYIGSLSWSPSFSSQN